MGSQFSALSTRKILAGKCRPLRRQRLLHDPDPRRCAAERGAGEPSLAQSKTADSVPAGAPQIDQFRQPILPGLAVACYDLGEFVRFYPAGRQMANTLGIKPLVMSLMSHPDKPSEFALASCTKMMVGNWQAVSES